MKLIRKHYKILALTVVIAAALLIFCFNCFNESDIYSSRDNWAYFAVGGTEKPADLFILCPTVDTRDEYNMSLSDSETKKNFLGALNMERGIYEDNTRMYAPYYRQAALKVYDMPADERDKYIEIAYRDVSAAFAYYLKHENNNRPIILAGFSQGADMCYRLLQEYFADKKLYGRLVAVYAIGWPCTDSMTEKYSQIKPASSEKDIGVVISFECESPNLTSTHIYPAGIKAHAINPLNWKTDSTPADKSMNPGACFTDYGGNITKEIANLCGAYIDSDRGVLKIPDLKEEDYPPVIPSFKQGMYHVYDYMFFFRSLQENVKTRIDSFMKNAVKEA